MKILKMKRVSYGSDKTPIELREYCITFGSAVGCQDEAIQLAKDLGCTEIGFTEKDGTTRKVEVK